VHKRRSNSGRARARRSSAAPRRIPQQERSRARVEAILRSARRLIGERSDASMREIAEAARVPIASVYQYFPDKTAVLRALVQEFYDRMRVRLDYALNFVERVEGVPLFTDAMIDGLVIELGAARSHLNVWTAAQSSPVLVELDLRDALELADLLCERFQQIAPTIDPERIRDACVFAVVMAGPVVRQSFLMPKADGDRMIRELKALIRLRVESLSEKPA
jgi:AcrR family transcriptional regulator